MGDRRKSGEGLTRGRELRRKGIRMLFDEMQPRNRVTYSYAVIAIGVAFLIAFGVPLVTIWERWPIITDATVIGTFFLTGGMTFVWCGVRELRDVRSRRD